jgi:Contractile injection system tube protein
MTLTKARLIATSPKDKNLDIEFMFNPTEVSFTRSAKWEYNTGNRGERLLPKVNFSGIEPYKFTLSGLLFDTYETKKSVTGCIENIKNAVEAPRNKPDWRPPIYFFQWGDIEYYHCVITSFTYKLTMFLKNGTPVRAIVEIVLQEVDPKNTAATPQAASKGDDRTAGPSSNLGSVG